MNFINDENYIDIIKEKTNIYDFEFVDCVFENCKFIECNITHCTFSECKFINCSFVGNRMKDISLLFSEFIECTIVGVSWLDLQAGSITFPIAKLQRCYLKYNDFEKMNFKKFDFEESSIIDSNFVRCNLSESNFKNCDLKNTHFAECDLKKSDFRKAKGYEINMIDNQIKGAKFTYIDAINLLKYFDIVIEK